MTITLTPEAERELETEAARRELTPDPTAMQALIAGLRGRPVPQSMEDLPRRPLPAGKTLRDLFEDFRRDHPSRETDEDVRLALEELS